MQNELVTVICLCHNHKPFLKEAIESVINQSYNPIQIILVDDASTDGSKEVLQQLAAQYSIADFINIDKNVGNCTAFNRALRLARGEYIVDMATDDVFDKERIEKQVRHFKQLPKDYGVIHTDAVIIDYKGDRIREHYRYLKSHNLIKKMPQGDVYADIIDKYFVAPPTMLMKRAVFDDINGYDEKLSYEDFDFWVRSARNWKYAYLDEPLTFIRKIGGSKSSKLYLQGDKQLYSTYLVCRKIADLNQSKEEDLALLNRLRYEFRQSVITNNKREANLFFDFLKERKGVRLTDKLLKLVNSLPINFSGLSVLMKKLRYS